MKAKRWISAWAALAVLLLAVPVLAAEGVTLNEVAFVTMYGDAVETPEGNSLMALALREKENTREGENLTVACLRCVGANGETVWEHRDATSGNNIYVQPAIAVDGSILAAVHHYEAGGNGLNEYVLRRFSPAGELLAEEKLPESNMLFLNMVEVKGALCALYRTTQPGDGIDLENDMVCVCFDESLKPVATIRGRNTPVARWGDGWLLLDRSEAGEYSAMLADSEGRRLWTRSLMQQRNSAESGMLYAFAGNGDLQVLTFDWAVSTRQPTAATLTRCTPQGEVIGQMALELPEMKGDYAFCDLRETADGYMLLAIARTETRLRVMRFNRSGKLESNADAFVEDDVYYRACFAKLGGRDYLCACSREDQTLVRLLPLDERKGE